VKVAASELAPIASAVVTQAAVPELTVTGLHASAVVPFLKVMVPGAVNGETVAVSVTLAPYAAVVIAVAGADVSPAASVVVVAAWVIETVFVDEVLVVSSADVVGVKAAVSELLPTGSAAVARVHVPAAEPATPDPSTVLPLEKLTVPASAGETVAVSVTLTPKAAVVTAVAGADVSPTTSAVVVVACDTVTVDAVEVLAT
jgi:hypothetical protein